MKKKYIIPGLLAAVSVVGLAACDNEDKDAKTLSDLEISGYTENFTVGDTFAKGELKVEAKYSDDSVVDVTNDENLKISAPTSLSEPGTYAVIVSYGGLSEAYQIKVKSSSVGGDTPVVTVKDLTLTGAKTDFVVGDTFVTTGLKVEAKYSDTTTKDVTSDEDVKIEGPTSLNQVGSYSVLVSFGGITKAYQIQVSDVHRTLDSIEVNTTGTKLTYVAGVSVDDISTDVSLNYIYEDDNQVETIEVVTDLSGYTKAIKDAAGAAVTGTISEAGTYTVMLSKGDDTASFDIVVTPDISSVGKALAVGVANQAHVKSGNTTVTQSNEHARDDEYYTNASTEYSEYEFGKDYYFTKEYTNGEVTSQGHIFKYQNEIYGINAYPNDTDPTVFDNLQKMYSDSLNEDSFKGYYYYQFGFENVMDATGNEKLAYGTDGLLENLYYFGSKNQNGDFKETIEHNAGYDTYHFSFGHYNADYEMFSVFEVSFNLGDDYIFDNVRITKNNYIKKLLVDSYGEPVLDDNKNYQYISQYVVDEKTGYYSIADNAPSRGDNYYTAYIDQVSGERDLEPTYTGDQFIAEDITIKDSTGKELHDGDTIQAVLGTPVELTIEANPEIESWVLDEPIMDSILYSYYSTFDNKIYITTSTCGEFAVEIQTTNCLITLNVVIPKANPDTMAVKQFLANEDNPNQAAYTDEISTVKAATNTPIYLLGVPKANGDANNADATKYTMSLVGEATGCTLQQVECSYQDGKVSVWEFNGTAAGTYSIEVCSTIEGCEEIKTIFTVEVVDIVSMDLAQDVLNGSYTYTDPNYQLSEDLAVEFTPESEGALSGTVTLHTAYYTRMGGSVDFDATYTYQVDADTKAVTLTKVSSSEEAKFSITISELYDIVVNFSFGNAMINNAILKKAEPVVELNFSEVWQGTWSGEDTYGTTYKLNVSAKEATFYLGGDLMSGTYAFQSESVLILTVTDFMGTSIYTFTLSDTTLSYADEYDNAAELTKSDVAEDKYPTAWQGTWTGTDQNGAQYVLTITANDATLYKNEELFSDPSISTFTLQSATVLKLEVPDYGEIHTFELSADGNSISYTSSLDDIGTFEKTGGADNPTPAVSIPEAWVGTYTFTDLVDNDGDGVNETEVNYTLVISSTGATYTVEVDGQEETFNEVLEVTDTQITISSGYPMYSYIFTVSVADNTVTDDLGNVYHKMGR